MTEFQDLIDHANALVKTHRPRVEAQNEYAEAFLLQDDTWKGSSLDWVKELRDTTPFQSVITPVNILSTGQPQFTFTIPVEAEQPNTPIMDIPDYLRPHIPEAMNWPKLENPNQDRADKLEKMMKYALRASDSRQDMSLLREVVLSGFLYSQCIIKIADLRFNALNRRQTKPLNLRGKPPFNYKACAPQDVFFERDSLGLSFVLHRYIRSLYEIKQKYPNVRIPESFKADEGKNAIWCEAWTPEKCTFWIQSITDEPTVDQTTDTDKLVIVQKTVPNVFGFAPFAIRTARGTRLFDKPEQQLFPLLYSGVRSKLFKRANLFLTVASTLAFGMANPQFALESQDPNEQVPTLDFNAPNIYKLGPGSRLTPITMALNKDVIAMMQMIQQKEEEATIPRALAGQIPGGWGGSAASWLNMVIQGGKLEVVPVQMPVQECYEQVAGMTLDYLRRYAELAPQGALDFYAGASQFIVQPDEIPEYVDITCQLKADLPQDRQMQFDMALKAWKGLMIDHETALEIAGVEDKNQVNERLKKERQEQQQAPPGALPGIPPGMPPGMPPNIPTGLSNVPRPGAVEQNPMVPPMGEQMSNAMMGGMQGGMNG